MVVYGVAFGSSAARNGLTQMPAVPDPLFVSDGGATAGFTVPSWAKYYMGSIAVGATVTRAQLRCGTFRALWGESGHEINPFGWTLAAATGQNGPVMLDRGIPLTSGEALTAWLDNTNVAEFDHIMAFFSDRQAWPTKNTSPFTTVRATGSTTVTANRWTPVPITFTDSVPGGTYDIIGARFQSATPGLARIIPQKEGNTLRPTFFGVGNVFTYSQPITLGQRVTPFRGGQDGTLYRFDTKTPPSIEVLCSAADTAQTVFYDLVKVK